MLHLALECFNGERSESPFSHDTERGLSIGITTNMQTVGKLTEARI
jgi:hypothetical protein